MKFSLKKIRRTIPAGSQSDIDVYGDKVFAYSVPSGAKISFDNGEAVELRTGLRYGSSSGLVAALVAVLAKAFPKLAGALSEDVFQKISIINENAFEITVEILAGFGDIADDSTTISNVVPTREKARRLTLVQSTSGMAAGTLYYIWRDVSSPVQVVLENKGAVDLRISRSNAAQVDLDSGWWIRVEPRERVTFDVSGGFSIWCAVAGGSFTTLGFVQD